VKARTVRAAAVGVLVIEATVLAVAGTVAAARPDSVPAGRGTVVQSQCIEGHIVQGIDDGNPDGLLSYDTGASC
jgi:hypothetical protein